MADLTTMLEKMAQAMWVQRGFSLDEKLMSMPPRPAWTQAIPMARAALLAIREPDEGVLLASGMLDADARLLARSMWSDMIGEILNEGGETEA